MEKKKFTLHVSFVYAISECTNFSETDVEFFEDSSGAVELGENGRPKITPDVLDDIRDMLEDKWECEVVILHWQWFD